MAPLEADGPYGLEALHDWAVIGGALLVSMGNREVWPWYRLRGIAGLYDLPAMDDIAEDVTEGVGSVPYPSRARSKNVTYTLDVLGRTLQEMRQGIHTLRQAFGPDIATGLNPLRRMYITPQPYAEPLKCYQARCLSFVAGDEKQDRGRSARPTPYVRSVVIGLRMYDPRIYTWNGSAQVNPQW